MALPGEGNISGQLDDNSLYDAHIKNGKLHGSWKSWYENGLLCDSGTFVKGIPDGEWKHWSNKGHLISLRTYSAEKLQLIKNEFTRYNLRRPSFPLTVLYHKNKKAALKYLRSAYSFTDAGRKKEGFSLEQLIAANIAPGNVFDYSLHHGLYINFFADGTANDSGYYKNGLKQGVWIHRDAQQGIVLRGSYENGIKVKGWRTYDDSGKLLAMVFYNRKGEVGWRKDFRKFF